MGTWTFRSSHEVCGVVAIGNHPFAAVKTYDDAAKMIVVTLEPFYEVLTEREKEANKLGAKLMVAAFGVGDGDRSEGSAAP